MSSAPRPPVTEHPAVETLIPAFKLTHGYITSLLDGVTPEMFARQPEGVAANHPAYVLGHIAYYCTRIMTRLGVGSMPDFTPELEALFAMNVECMDDPAGTFYPPMVEIVDLYSATMDAVIENLPNVDPERFDAAPEGKPFGGLVTTNASLATFMLIAHPMMHAGQISTWRRCMGLGPCKIG